MKQTLVFLIAWLATTALSAQQSTISGIVSIHNSAFDTGKRQYVANAQVEDDFEKATAQVTDANGIFKLIFVGIPEKTTVNLIVKKEGLEVVNIDALGAVTGQRDQVRLSMAAPNKIAEYRRQIYNIGKTEAEKNLAALLQKKGKEIEALQKDTKANAAKIQTLQTEYAALSDQSKKIEEQAQELARKYAPINLDDASPLYQEAFRFFQKGELDQALKILQQANLAQQANKILQERQSIANVRKEADQRDSIQQQRTTDVIEALQFKADLHNSRFEFDSTAVCYEIMLQLDSNNISTLGNYAYFLSLQRQDQRAISLFEKALSLSFLADESRAYMLANLGILYGRNFENTKAETALKESLQIYRHLFPINPSLFQHNVATVLNNLAQNYRLTNNTVEAEAFYIEALQLDRQLTFKEPEKIIYWLSLAKTLNNLGVLYKDNQRMLEAENVYLEALQIQRQLTERNPEAYLPDLAMTLNNLGGFYHLNLKMVQAEDAFNEALQIYRKLAAINPDAFSTDLAGTLNNLGNFYQVSKKNNEAENYYLEALQTKRRLLAKNPETFSFSEEVAQGLNNLGLFYYSNQIMYKAEDFFQEALTIYRQLSTINPNRFLPNIARTLNNLANYYRDNQIISKAEQSYQEALQIQRQIVKESPDVFLPDLAATLNNFGVFNRINGNLIHAKVALDESLQIYRQLANKNQDVFLINVASTLNNVGNYYADNQQLIEAESAFLESIQIYRQLAVNTFNTVAQDLAGTLNNLGITYRQKMQIDQAEIALEEALQIQQKLATTNPNTFLPNIAMTLNNLGMCARTAKKYNEALNFYAKTIAILEKLILAGGNHHFPTLNQVVINIYDVRDSTQLINDYQNCTLASHLLAECFDHLKEMDKQAFSGAVNEYGNLSGWALLAKDYNLAEKAAIRCFELDNTQEWFQKNLGHAYLFQGKFFQAQGCYEKLKSKKDLQGKDYQQVILNDITALEQAGITHPDMAKMKAWLAGW